MNENNVISLIKEHIKRYSLIQVTDIYKLLFQGVYGVGHIISEKAWERLIEEADRINLEEYLDEPLIESVSPDKDFVRVNLRPYLRKGLPLRALYNAMIKTSKEKGDAEKLISYWKTFKNFEESEDLGYNFGEIKKIENSLLIDGPIPRHHTKIYRDAYYPAYRVIKKELFDALIRENNVIDYNHKLD
ncbi:MAG: hypothetical protein ACXAEX_23540 [Promethearchaeota archaeon]|jgi:hypothetical protein